MSRYFENQAEEDSDVEDHQDSDVEIHNADASKEFVVTSFFLEDNRYKPEQLKRSINHVEVLKRIEERALNEVEGEAEDEVLDDDLGEQPEEFEDQPKILPTQKDPKLWQVKCKRGMEKQACMSLMGKCIESAKKKIP